MWHLFRHALTNSIRRRIDMGILRTIMLSGVAGASVVGMASQAPGAGADIKYSGLAGQILRFGPINNTYAYILGSNTCNVGDASLSWVGSGTPALMMNAYRLHGGRLVQIGTGNAKTACCVVNSTSALCCTPPTTSCCSGAGFGLRPGCMDTYSASFNSSQPKLAPRRAMNPQTGVISSFSATSGDAIYRRLQIREADMNATAWPGALFFVEGQYICLEDAIANNDTNNASYARVSLDGSYGMTAQGSVVIGFPAIYAWRDHGGGAGVPDPNVSVQTIDVFGAPGQPPMGEGGSARLLVACKVTPSGNLWHYEYAVQNLTSARGVGAFSVPIPPGASISNAGFHDAWYHDDDAIYDGTDWNRPESTYQVRWETAQTFAQNPNANALRYGTIYNFWFDCDQPPVAGEVELEMFNPGTGCVPQTLRVGVPAPAAIAAGDVVRNGFVDVDDLISVILDWGPCACVHDCPSDVIDNNVIDVDDLIAVITGWSGGK
jgi:hypothetical protein